VRKSIFEAGFAYFCVVLVGFVLDLAIFALLVHWQVGIVLANTVAFLAGASCNALLVRAFVFDQNRFSRGVDFLMTLTINVAVFAAGTALLAWFVEHLGLHPYPAKLIANALTLIANFSIRATFFRKI
jgi:putative flippase GtrA